MSDKLTCRCPDECCKHKEELMKSLVICQICGEKVRSVYHNMSTGKSGHKRCV